jgi:methionyl-tRNA formyltransferase
MGSTRIIFMGTPGFAVPSLSALVDAGFDVAAVVTRPERPSGRGRRVSPTPVKLAALERGIEVLEPVSVKDEGFIERLKALVPDFLVVVAYGKILPGSILQIPGRGCVNVHASLLPRYRGAAPINHAILNGESVTGVSTMLMDAGMDTGPVLLAEEVGINRDDTAEDLAGRLSKVGAALLVKTIALMVEGKLRPEVQDESGASYAPSLKKGDGEISWQKSAEEIRNLVRGLYPWPGTYTRWKGKLLKVHGGRAAPDHDTTPGAPDYGDASPGTVVSVSADSVGVKCGQGVFEITELQLQDRRRMNAGVFAKGYSVAPGDRFVA